jgi:hypothetical protein
MIINILGVLFLIAAFYYIVYDWYKLGGNSCPKCNDNNNTRLFNRLKINETSSDTEYFNYYKCNACGHTWQEYSKVSNSD